MTTKIVEKFISQRCIGYQKRNSGIWSVTESRVRFRDGTEETVWEVYPPINSSIPLDGFLLERPPHIDIPQS